MNDIDKAKNIQRLSEASMMPIKFIGGNRNVLICVCHKLKPNVSSNSSKDKIDDEFVLFE